jgi:hypothetical protein
LNNLEKTTTRTATIAELLGFLWKKKQWWLLPIVISLLMLGILLTLASSSPLGHYVNDILTSWLRSLNENGIGIEYDRQLESHFYAFKTINK